MTVRDIAYVEKFFPAALIAISSVLSASNTIVEHNERYGLEAYGDGTTVTLADCAITDTFPGTDGSPGTGILVAASEAGDTVSLVGTRCLIEGNTENGLVVGGAGAEVMLEDSTIGGTLETERRASTIGFAVVAGARFVGKGLSITGNVAVGVVASDEGTVLTLDRSEIQDTIAGPDGDGIGLRVENGADVTMNDTSFARNVGLGLFLTGDDTSVRLDNGSVTDTVTTADGASGWGVTVQDGALFRATRTTIERNAGLGIHVSGAATVVGLTDSFVRYTVPNGDEGDGSGINVNRRAPHRWSGSQPHPWIRYPIQRSARVENCSSTAT